MLGSGFWFSAVLGVCVGAGIWILVPMLVPQIPPTHTHTEPALWPKCMILEWLSAAGTLTVLSVPSPR